MKINWRASKASETLSGLFNRDSRYIYVYIYSVNSPIIANPESAPIIAFPVLQLYERRHQLLSMLSEYSKSRAPFWR